MIKVVVDRKKWCRGDSNTSRLLCKNGTMCCIGFLARVLKYKRKDILNVSTLDDTHSTDEQDGFSRVNRSTLANAYGVNDDSTISDKVREKELKKIGKEMDVWFVFKN